MNKRERIECVFAHEEPDRVPIFDWVSNIPLLEHFAGQDLTLDNAETVVPRASGQILDVAPLWLPASPERRTDERGFTIEGADWFNQWIIGYPWQDYDGMVAWVGAQIEEMRAWRPPAAETLAAGRLRQHALIERYGEAVVAGHVPEALEVCFPLIGLESYCYLLADHPELAQAWLDARHERTLRMLSCGADLRADPQLYRVVCLTADVAFKGKPLFSPAYLRESGYFRRIAELCRLYHDHGVKVILHSDGQLTSLLPDFIAAGIDALNPIDLSAGMDLAAVKEAFGDRLVLAGGIEGALTLPFGTPDEVRAATLQALRAGAPGGGYMASSSAAEWFNDIPLENLLAMLETIWEYGRYPLRLPA